MQIDSLIIELTRKCNLKCEHCLRGRAQRKDIDPITVCKFLHRNKIDYINDLTFTGGEPCLNPYAMRVIANYLAKNKVQINMFYMATNGTVFDYSMIEPLTKIHSLCDPEYFMIEISKDDYHDNHKNIHNVWNLIAHSERKGNGRIIAEGKGININPYGQIPKDSTWTWDAEDPDRMENGEIYINALGMICKDCDYSYATQKKRNIGHCLSKPLKEF